MSGTLCTPLSSFGFSLGTEDDRHTSEIDSNLRMQEIVILSGRLETLRLFVRPFVADDIPHLVALFADPEVARFLDDGFPLSHDLASAWVSKSNENLMRFGFGTGAVIVRQSLEMIGWAGVARPEGDSEEIIYGLSRAHWNKGYGRELVAALSDFALARGINPVRATVDRENGASVRLLTENGFILAARDYRSEANTDLYERHDERTCP